MPDSRYEPLFDTAGGAMFDPIWRRLRWAMLVSVIVNLVLWWFTPKIGVGRGGEKLDIIEIKRITIPRPAPEIKPLPKLKPLPKPKEKPRPLHKPPPLKPLPEPIRPVHPAPKTQPRVQPQPQPRSQSKVSRPHSVQRPRHSSESPLEMTPTPTPDTPNHSADEPTGPEMLPAGPDENTHPSSDATEPPAEPGSVLDPSQAPDSAPVGTGAPTTTSNGPRGHTNIPSGLPGGPGPDLPSGPPPESPTGPPNVPPSQPPVGSPTGPPTERPRGIPTGPPAGDLTRRAHALRHPRPTFPAELRTSALTSSVEVVFHVHQDGTFSVSLVSSSGNNAIDNIVLQTAARWKWEPRLVNGEPVEDTVSRVFDINFTE